MKGRVFLIVFVFFVTLQCYSQDSSIVAIAQDVDTMIFKKVEIEASFPGGVDAWRTYLMKNLKAATPVRNKAPNGTYMVIVRFIVSKNGSVSEIQAETNHGYGMEQEVLRVIKKGPKWTPAIQDGRAVNAYRRQPITFVVSGS